MQTFHVYNVLLLLLIYNSHSMDFVDMPIVNREEKKLLMDEDFYDPLMDAEERLAAKSLYDQCCEQMRVLKNDRDKVTLLVATISRVQRAQYYKFFHFREKLIEQKKSLDTLTNMLEAERDRIYNYPEREMRNVQACLNMIVRQENYHKLLEFIDNHACEIDAKLYHIKQD